ncbi:hypothetical protein VNO77_01084 [Canavalia gladiata]|uniref:Transmembrane protein n=1 Tax=Canavalia gladiata TaxID=3824 RepID=A0AAN9MVW4_CANGL
MGGGVSFHSDFSSACKAVMLLISLHLLSLFNKPPFSKLLIAATYNQFDRTHIHKPHPAVVVVRTKASKLAIRQGSTFSFLNFPVLICVVVVSLCAVSSKLIQPSPY